MNAPPPFGQFPGLGFPALRFREAGDVTLDLAHRDARVVDCWLALGEGEFALLWHMAEAPGTPVTGGLAHHAAGLRAKLEPFGLAGLIADHPEGGFTLDPHPCGPLDRTRRIGQS
ncbi:response regulator transcription factor [Porphyrobacter sp. YT40]|uniref:response regulator transcription factor n=1 Tax=Porphyrobacter sp. YT40 TaxID=2547601 RepID=UPI001143462E|nr:response regulator transcription factor [Porphyrobacter sp. YT40]QDH32965.1 response regulator transcription factor [Porphyrobacter sp. YT40]